ncbi:mannan endo-1,4-beta-mannosidase [Clostridium sp. DSM 8431]|uniref:discoidin domain-containing protein n=1 Tax=Clostridium sp. DSM 8431 TaxID=1761781 RepID=UPI0008DFAF2B|nr:discoidin domain-containing protein [Clostridium sp. DSM 8431]SFU75946.1 mannan endo-1,4-beta-mannosidase [Clostridium sp. DSM 8431]
MKKKHFLLGLFCALLFVLIVPSKAAFAATDETHPGFRVDGRFLYDNQGEKTVLYGINKMVVWQDKDGDPSFREIAKTGANCVRIVWTMKDGTPDELDTAITNCRAEHMIPIIELHDATGEFDKLQSLVDWWVKPEVVQVIQKHQEYLLVNIGNEVGDGNVSNDRFKTEYTKAVTRMREAGIHVSLVIDPSSWGQNLNQLQACGLDIQSADPDHNCLFSAHLWWPYMYGHTDKEVVDELTESAEMGLPLVIGEFANQWEQSSQGQIPYKVIMEYCAKYEIGYLIWSWGPGNSPQTFLDMTTDGNFDTLQPWAKEMLFDNEYSLSKLVKIPNSMLSGLPAQKPAKPLKAGNLALGKTVTFSSKEDASYEGNNITDGNFDTRWASQSNSSNDWVCIDLGSTKDINEVLIKWENAYATQYKIQVSNDGTSWDDVYQNYSGKGGLDDINLSSSVTARYVRINCSQKINYSWGYSIWELGIYGADSEKAAIVSEDAAVFDKNVRKASDLTFSLNKNGNNLIQVKNGENILTESKDYTVSDNEIVIKKSYLSSLEKGTIQLQLVFDNDLNTLINIAIGDTTPIGGNVILMGDINNDGEVDLADYTLLRKYLNAATGTNIQINTEASDLNEDGEINFFDLVALKAAI